MELSIVRNMTGMIFLILCAMKYYSRFYVYTVNEAT